MGASPFRRTNAMFSIIKRLLTGRQFTSYDKHLNERHYVTLASWERTEIRIRPWLRRIPLEELTTLPRRPHSPLAREHLFPTPSTPVASRFGAFRTWTPVASRLRRLKTFPSSPPIRAFWIHACLRPTAS